MKLTTGLLVLTITLVSIVPLEAADGPFRNLARLYGVGLSDGFHKCSPSLAPSKRYPGTMTPHGWKSSTQFSAGVAPPEQANNSSSTSRFSLSNYSIAPTMDLPLTNQSPADGNRLENQYESTAPQIPNHSNAQPWIEAEPIVPNRLPWTMPPKN
jgi:hypothetical protein